MSENAGNAKHKTITIERTLNLPLETVWQAWTEAENFKKWWGPKEYTCNNCNMDFQVGGKYVYSLEGSDGKEVWSTGVYKEIEPMKKLVYTDCFADNKGMTVYAAYYRMPGDWAMELLVTLELEAQDGKTRMNLKHEGLSTEMADDRIKTWNSSFDKLEGIFT